MEAIRNKWQSAKKVTGLRNVIILADGSTLSGTYILTESGACTPSHNALDGFTPSVGFPTDKNGGTVNNRNYERDREAQKMTLAIAANYDARALQSPVIVSKDGVVLSGNGRTMSGELAALDGTDTAYIAYLRDYCVIYGFTLDDVTVFAHPRVLFEIDSDLPYTVATFAIFNAQDMKTQSKTEEAITFGKLVDDETFGRIVSTINAFETLSDFYACTEAATRCIKELVRLGVINDKEIAKMFDGDSVSLTGREKLENTLIGKAFASDEDTARRLEEYRNIRRSVILALGEVSNNLVLGDDYSLSGELQQAISLAYTARKEGDYKDGERVSEFARQINLFDGGTVADFRNKAVLYLADVLNDKRDAQLKKVLAVYNYQAKESANGQMDMFCETGVKKKQDILSDILDIFATSSAKEQKEAVSAAVTARLDSSLFLTDEQLTKVVKGSYVVFRCKAGDSIICQVEDVKRGIAYLIGKGGVKLWATVSELVPTADHTLSLPEWVKAGNVITDGTACQRIAAVTDGTVILEWINGGYFDVTISNVLQGWSLSDSDVCEIKEAA